MELPSPALLLDDLRILESQIETLQLLGSMSGQLVEATGGDEALESATVDCSRVEALAQIEKGFEGFASLAALDNRPGGAGAHVLDRGKAKADAVRCRREEDGALVDIGGRTGISMRRHSSRSTVTVSLLDMDVLRLAAMYSP